MLHVHHGKIWKSTIKYVQFETFWRQIWRNVAHQKFMTNISFVPSICIYRSIILIFIVCLSIFSMEIYFSAIFDYHNRENPRFRNEFQALIHAKIWQQQLLHITVICITLATIPTSYISHTHTHTQTHTLKCAYTNTPKHQLYNKTYKHQQTHLKEMGFQVLFER